MLNLKTIKLFKSVVTPGNDVSALRLASFSAAKARLDECLHMGVDVDVNIIASYNIDDLALIANEAKTLGYSVDNFNSSFYKTFDEADSKSIYELRADQLRHYISTYGSNDIEPVIYEPVSFESGDNTDTTLVFIKGITIDELTAKVTSLLNSGVAIDSDLVEDIQSIINDYDLHINIDNVLNKEFKCRHYLSTNTLPVSFDELMRLIVFVATGRTLLIKSPEVKAALSDLTVYSADTISDIIKRYVNTYGYESAARNVTRYRKLILLVRGQLDRGSKTVINKVLKLSKTLYVARPTSVMSNLANSQVSVNAVKSAAEKATTYDIVRGINYLKEQLSVSGQHAKLYTIRNGKSYVKIADTSNHDAFVMLDKLKLLLDTLSARYKHLAGKTAYIPAEISFGMPTSTKSFVGDLPLFTRVSTQGPIIAGVAWRQNADVDLSAVSTTGQNLGWNAGYRTDSGLVASYSGDMTSLNSAGYASEYMLLKSVTSPVVMQAALFTNMTNADIDLDWVIASHASAAAIGRDSMLDNSFDDVKLLAKSKLGDRVSANIMIKPTGDETNDAIVMDINRYNGRIVNVDQSKLLTEALVRQADAAMTVNSFLKMVGVNVVSDQNAAVDYDFSLDTLTKSTFIDLMEGGK